MVWIMKRTTSTTKYLWAEECPTHVTNILRRGVSKLLHRQAVHPRGRRSQLYPKLVALRENGGGKGCTS